MNKSITQILEALSNQIDSNELTAALKADKWEGEYELSEDGITSILSQTKGLLSVDSAINNADVVKKVSEDLYPKHMKSALIKVEDQLKPIFDKLGIDYSKLEFVSDAIKDIEPKISEMSNGDNKGLIESLNEDIRTAKEALTTQGDQHIKDLQKRDDDILADKIYQKYKSKATEKQWAEAYSDSDIREAILNQKWNKINAKAHLILSDSGDDIIPMQKEFPDKELYDGNKVQTFQSLLEPEFEAYLKKSAPAPDPPGVKTDGAELSEADKKRLAEHDRQKKRAEQD